MPRLIDPGAGEAIGLADLVEALNASDFDARDEASFASVGPLLAQLGRNPTFLSDLAVDELKGRRNGPVGGNVYGAQVLLLTAPNGRYVLRANFWPSHSDAAFKASGAAAFFYGMPHDHNFPFLTYGYLGPGYWSDYYDYDRDLLVGVPGECAGLRFVERSRLEPGRLMLYRAHRDVHAQLPPDRFSVSLNILGYDLAQPWHEQYRFDIPTGTIAEGLTTTPSEALVALAAHFGGGNGADLVHHFARHHPVPRMRMTAINAVASTLADRGARFDWLAAATADSDRYVAQRAVRQCASLEILDH